MQVLGFASDGSYCQILGISVVINELLLSGNHIDRIVVAVPTPSRDKVLHWLRGHPDLPPIEIVEAIVSNSDRYFVQLSLVQIFDLLAPADHLLCLDYDHVVPMPRNIPWDADSHRVLVSSEIRPLSPPLEQFGEGGAIEAQINTSMLMGRVDRLRAIGKRWHSAYTTLAPTAPRRYLVEIAFGLAAVWAGVPLMPCSAIMQGNFSQTNMQGLLFHYGGESDVAHSLKVLLCDLASNRHDAGASTGILSRVHQRILTELMRALK